jgi:ubiquinone biosynthesis protein
MALAEFAEHYDPNLRLYQPRAAVSAFRRILMQELDFRREEWNLEQFSSNFADDPIVHIPRPFPELSSRRVLTMEMLEGFSVANSERVKSEGIDTKELAKRGAGLYLDMIFRDGFYHADPHPGNIWILAGGKIGLLDCGMVGRLDEETREAIEEMLLAGIQRDTRRLADHIIRIGSVPQGLDRESLQTEISEFLAEYSGASLRDFDVSGALIRVTEIIRRYRIILPPGITLLLKVLVMLEGTSRLLNRDFSLAELLQPYYAKAIQRRFSPDRLLHRLQRTYWDWDRFVDMIPRELADILQRIRDGRFDVYLEHRRLDTIVNRLVYGILTAALFLGSCQLLSEKIPPLIGGVSIIGAGGCIVALWLGLRLLRAVKKSGDIKYR